MINPSQMWSLIRRSACAFACVVVACMALAPAIHAGDADAPRTWTGADFASNTNWTNDNSGKNWDLTNLPNGTSATATFPVLGVGVPYTVTLDKNVVLSAMTFNAATDYTIAPAASETITFNTTGAGATLTVTDSFAGADGHVVSCNLVLAKNLTIDVAAGKLLKLTGVISGSGFGITKTGLGTLILTNANTFTGGLVASAGTIRLGDNAAAGTGTITLSGGQLEAITASRSLANAVTFSAASSVSGSQAIDFQGLVTVSGTPGLTVNNSADTTISGKITGTSFSKAGSGVLILGSTANDFTGTLLVTGGTLRLGAAGVVTDTVAMNLAISTVFDLNGNNETIGSLTTAGTSSITLGSATLTVSGSSTTTAAGPISGSGGLTYSGTGNLTLSGANTYSGATTVSSGTLTVANGSALGTTAGATSVTGSGKLALSGGVIVAGETLTLNSTASGALTNTSGFNLWTSAITCSQATSITSTAGTLLLGSINSGTFVVTLQGAGDGQVTGAITTTGGVTKSGAGTWTLSAANTFTGATTVTAGTLTTQAGMSGAAITVQNNAIFGIQGSSLTVANNITLVGTGTLRMISGTGTAASGSITMDESGGNPVIQVESGASLTHSGVIAGTLVGGDKWKKQGAGTFTIAGGASATTNAGTLVCEAGIVRFNKTAGTNAQIGNIDCYGGTVQWMASNQVADTAQLYMAGGTVNLAGFSETIQQVDSVPAPAQAGEIALGSGSLTIGTGAATGGGLLRAAISGTGTITKTGSATLILDGINSYTGSTTISAGVVKVTNGSGLGTSAGSTSIASGAELQLEGVFTCAEPLTINGPGTGTAGAVQAVTSGTNVTLTGLVTQQSASTIGATTSGAALTLSAATAVTGTFNLTLNGSGTGTVSGILAISSGTLTKSGSGTWSLTGSAANTNAGLTTVSAGTLALGKTAGTNGLGGGATISGGILQLSNANQIPDASSVTLSSGSWDLNGKDEQVTGFTFGGGTLSNHTTNTLKITGTLAYAAGADLTIPGTIDVGTIANTSVANKLILSGVVTGTAPAFTGSTGTTEFSGSSANTFSGTLTVGAGTLRLNKTSGVAAVPGNLTINSGGTVISVAANQIADAALVTLSGGTWNQGGFAETLDRFTYTSGTISSAASTLTLANSGGTALTLQGGQTMTGALSLTGATTTVAVTGGASAATISGALALSGTTVNIDVANVTASPASDLILSGVVSGTANVVKATSNGTLEFAGTADNTATGGYSTSVASTTVLNMSNLMAWRGTVTTTTGTLAINAGNQRVESLAGSGSVVIAGGNLEIGRNGSDTTTSSVFSGPGTLWKFGTGTATLSGSSGSLTGTCAVYGGTLVLGNNSAVGTNALQLEAGTTLQANATRTIANNLNITGNVTIGGSSALTINGATTFSLGLPAAPLTLTVSNSATTTLAGTISASNVTGLTKAGSGTLALGASAFIPATTNGLTLSAGTLDFTGNNDNSLPSLLLAATTHAGNLILNPNDTLSLTTTGTATFNGVISGGGGLTAAGPGTSVIVIGGVNTYTGATTVSAGTLRLTGDTGTIAASSSLSIASGATFEIDGTGSLNPNRILDSADVNLSSSAVFMMTAGGAARSETIGKIVSSTGSGNSIILNDGSSDQLCTLTCSDATNGLSTTAAAGFTFTRTATVATNVKIFSANGYGEGQSIPGVTVGGSAAVYSIANGVTIASTSRVSQQAGLWNDPNTWVGGVPGFSDDVTIKHKVTLDAYPYVNSLIFDRADATTFGCLADANPADTLGYYITVANATVTVQDTFTTAGTPGIPAWINNVGLWNSSTSTWIINVGTGSSLSLLSLETDPASTGSVSVPMTGTATSSGLREHFLANIVKAGNGTLYIAQPQDRNFAASWTNTINAGTMVLQRSDARMFSGWTPPVPEPELSISGISYAIQDQALDINGTLDLYDNAFSSSQLSGVGTLTNSAGGAPTFTINGTPTQNFAGALTGTFQVVQNATKFQLSGTAISTATGTWDNRSDSYLLVNRTGAGIGLGPNMDLKINTGGTSGTAFDVQSNEQIGSITSSSNKSVALKAGRTLTVSNGGTLAGQVTGSGNLGLTGGTLVMSGAHTYTGTTTIDGSGAILQVSARSGIGGGATNSVILKNGGTFDLSGSPGLNFTAGTTAGFSVGSGGGVVNLGAKPFIVTGFDTANSDALTIKGTGTCTMLVASGTRTIAGPLLADSPVSTIGLTKSGGGTLILSNAGNTFRATTTISGGILEAAGAGSLGDAAGTVTIAAGATLQVSGGHTGTANPITSSGTIQSTTGTNVLSGAITMAAHTTVKANAASILNLSGVIGESVAGRNLTKSDSGGDLILSSTGNTYTGSTTIATGAVTISRDDHFGTAPGTPVDTQLNFGAGTTLTLTTDLTVAANRGITLTGSGAWTLAPAAGKTLTLSSKISGNGSPTCAGGAGSIVVLGNAANSFAGTTTITTGTLRFAADTMLGNTANGLSLQGGTLEPTATMTIAGTRTIDHAQDSAILVGSGQDVTFNGDRTGSASMTKQGQGTLRFGWGSTANTTSAIVIAAGTLEATSATALGSPAVGATTIASGATLAISSGAGITIGERIASVTGSGVGGLGAIRNLSGDNVLSNANAITMVTATTIGVDAGSLTVGASSTTGAIAGSSSLTKIGAGALVLANVSNTFSGNVTLTAGVLRIAADGSLGASGNPLDLAGGTLQIGGNITTSRGIGISSNSGIDVQGNTFEMLAFGTAASGNDLTLAGTGVLRLQVLAGSPVTMAGALLGGNAAGKIQKSGAGTLTLTGANTFTNGCDVLAGTLEIGDGAALGATSSGTTVAQGAILEIGNIGSTIAEPVQLAGTLRKNNAGGTPTWSGDITLDISGSPVIASNGSSVFQISGNVTGALVPLQLQGTSANSNRIIGRIQAASLTKSGSGVWELANTSNAWNGDTTITDGTLATVASEVLPNLSNVVMGISGNPLLVLSTGASETVARITTDYAGAAINIVNGTLTSATDDSGKFAGTIMGAAGSLTKTGQGAWTLSNNNTYAGATTVSGGGSLRLVGDTGRLSATSSLAINSGSTFSITNDGPADPDRLPNSLVVTMTGGSFTMAASSNTLREEFIGRFEFASDSNPNTITLTPAGSGNCELTCTDPTAGLVSPGGATFTLVRASASGGGSGVAKLLSDHGFIDGADVPFGTVAGSPAIYTLANGVVNGERRVIAGGSWTSPATWLGGIVPTAGEDVTIGGFSVSLPAPTTIHSVTFTSTANTGAITGAALTVTSGIITTNANVTATVSAPLAGTSAWSKQGSGTLVISGAATATGPLTVTSGTLQLGPAPGDISTMSRLSIGGGATFAILGTGRTVTIRELAGNGDLVLAASGATNALVIDHANTSTSNTAQNWFQGVISGSGSLTKQGAGYQYLTGTNTYDGLTTISGGDLILSGSATAGDATAGIVVDNGATLGLVNANISATEPITLAGGTIDSASGVNSIASAITLSADSFLQCTLATSTMTVNGDIATAGHVVNLVGSSTSANVINGVISGSGSLNKSGTGTWAIGGVNTYTGTTVVSQGTLSLNSGASTAAASSVSVAEGATLSGSGALNGPVVFLSTSGLTDGTLAPGGAGIGTINTGALTLGATSPVPFFLGSFSDQVNVNGTLGLNGSLDFTSSGTVADGSYTLFRSSGLSGRSADPVSGEIAAGSGLSIGAVPGKNSWLRLSGTGDVVLVVDSAAPNVTAIQAFDLAGPDGWFDAIKITFDDKIRDTSVDAGNFTVSGGVVVNAFSSTTDGDSANNNVIWITFNDGVLGTGSPPTVTYTSGTTNLADLAGNQLAPFGPSTATDQGAPRMTAMNTVDSDGDGKIDGIRVTCNEAVNDGSFTAANWSVAGTTVTSLDTEATGNDRFFIVRFNESAVPDTSATPVLSYTKGTMADGLGNLMASFTGTPADGATPVLLSAATRDQAPQDGTLDTIVLTYSEVLATGTVFVPGNFTVGSSTATAAAFGATRDIVNLTIGGSLDTAATPAVTYAPGTLADPTGNAVVGSSRAAADEAGPVLLLARVLAGSEATLTFSEPIGAAITTANFTYAGGSTGALSIASMGSDSNGTDRIVTITGNPGFSLADYNVDQVTPTIGITDAAGNRAAGVSRPITTNDITAPSLLSMTTVDADNDGFIDGLRLTFDDGVLDSSVQAAITAGHFVISGGPSAITGMTTGAASDDATVILTFGGTSHTGVRPFLTYTNAMDVTDVTDASGNRVASFTATQAADGVAPRIKSATSLGGSTALTVTFTEPVFTSSGGSGNLTVSDFGYTDGATTQSVSAMGVDADGSDAIVTLTMSAAYLAGDFGVDGVRANNSDIFDASGNAVVSADRTVATTDITPPVISSVVTRDSGGIPAGRIDAVRVTFSKSILTSSATATGQWAVSNGVTITSVTPVGGSNGNVLDIAFSRTLDTSATPTLTYTAGTVVDTSGLALAGASKAATDGAAPVLLVRATQDLGGIRGALDAVKLTWSEPVQDITVIPGEFSVAGAGSLSFSSTTGTDVDNNAVIYLTFADVLTTGDTPLVGYSGSSLKDLSGNLAATVAPAAAVDQAAPVLMTARADGGSQTLTVTFSEPVSGSSTGAAALGLTQFTYGGGTAGAQSLATSLDASIGDATLLFSANANYQPGDFNVDTISVLASRVYDLAATANAAVPSPVAVTRSDTTAPTLVSAVTIDANSDGYVDGVRLTFSEPILDSTAVRASFTVDGSTPTSVSTGSAADDAVVDLVISNTYNTATTPTVNIIFGTLSDLSGNKVAAVSGYVPTDGVAPRVLSVNASVTNGAFPLNAPMTVQVTFSEPVTVTLNGGSVDLALNSSATVASASTTGQVTTLDFPYTVGSNQNAAVLDAASANALTLTGGATIVDGAGSNAMLALPTGSSTTGALANNKSIRIDTVPPTITRIEAQPASGTYYAAGHITVQVTFSEAVKLVSGQFTMDLNSNATNTTELTFTPFTLSTTASTDYVVALGDATTDLDVTATAVSSGTVFTDQAGNPVDIGISSLVNTLAVTSSVVVTNDTPTLTAAGPISLSVNTLALIPTDKLSATDRETQGATQLTYNLVVLPAVGKIQQLISGTWTDLTVSSHFTQDDIDNSRIAYLHTGTSAGTDAVVVTVSDPAPNSKTSTLAVLNFTIIGNAAPLVGLWAGTTEPYSEIADANDTAILVDGDATVTDADSNNAGDMENGKLEVQLLNGTTQDTLDLASVGVVTLSSSNVLVSGTIIGTYGGTVTGTGTLTVTFNANTVPSSVEQLVRAVTYVHTGRNPTRLNLNVQIRIFDGSGTGANLYTKTIAITPANDTPEITAPSVPLVLVPGIARSGQVVASDAEGNALTYAITSNPSKGSISIDANGAYIYTANTNAAAQGSDSFAVTVTDNGSPNRATLPMIYSVQISALGMSGPVFTSLPPMSAVQQEALYYAPTVDPASTSLQFHLIGLNGVMPAPDFTTSNGTINWVNDPLNSTDGVPSSATGYHQFGILVVDTSNNTAAYQPILLHVLSTKPTGN